MNAKTALQIRFCDGVVHIHCSDLDLYAQLARYFRHSLQPPETPLPETASLAAVYRIVVNDSQWQLWREDKMVHAAPEAFFIYMFLTRDVVAKLVNHCRQRLVFHAAGLAHRCNGLILAGRAGSGKSTLTAWLTATGFDFLADDVIALTPDSAELSGLTNPVVLKAGSRFVWERWLDDLDHDLVSFFNGAAWVDPDLLRSNCVQTAAFPKILVFPQYTIGQPLTVQPLSTAEATFRLMPQLINFAHFPDRGLAQIKSLARCLSAYSLIYDDVEAAAAWIRERLVELTAGE